MMRKTCTDQIQNSEQLKVFCNVCNLVNPLEAKSPNPRPALPRMGNTAPWRGGGAGMIQGVEEPWVQLGGIE